MRDDDTRGNFSSPGFRRTLGGLHLHYGVEPDLATFGKTLGNHPADGAPITLHHRTDFAASMIDGRTVMEVDQNSRSAQEVTALWNYISDRLEKNFRRNVFAPAPNGAMQMGGVPRPVGGFGRRVAQ